MMVQQNAEEGKMDEAEFVREIKGYRFSCHLHDQQIHLTLSNLQLDEFYQTAYDNSTLPENVLKYFTTVGQLQFYIREKTKIFKLLTPGVVMCAQYMGRVEKYVTIEMSQCGREDIRYMAFLKRYCRQLVEENSAVRTQLKGKELDYQNLETEGKRMKKLLEERAKDMERLREEIDSLKSRKRSNRKEKESKEIKEIKEGRDHKDRQDSKDSKDRELIKKEPEEIELRVVVPPIKKRKSRTSPRRFVKQEEKTQFGPSESEQEDDTPHMETENQEDSIFEGESSPQAEKLPETKKHVRQIVSATDRLVPFTLNFDSKNIHRFQIDSNRLEKILTSDTFQLYSTEPFHPTERSYFSIQLEKSKYKSLTMGLITAELFDLPASSAGSGCLCYEGYYGIVIVEGREENKEYRKLKEGDILTTLLDPARKLVEWRINLEVIAKVPLPQHMQNCPLFPFFELEDKGDRILINPEPL